MIRSAKRTVALISVATLWASVAHAQQRPLVTEDPETVGSGVVMLEFGMDYTLEEEFPASGLTGNLLRLPLYGLSFGVSSIAEIQIDGGLRNTLSIQSQGPGALSGMLDVSGDKTSSVEDIVIGTKVRLRAETDGGPALGFRFAIKLPNASNESGLGLDTTDFFASLLIGKTIRSVRVVGNFGLGILGDPTRGDRQNDVILYGISVARAVAEGVEVVGELNGRVHTRAGTPPPGTESRSIMRAGARYTRGAGRIDGALLVGVTTIGPGIGFAFGYTHAFNAMTIP